MTDRRPEFLGLLIATLGILCAGTGAAQISPGPLSSPHMDLEGSDQCLKCHSQKKRISAERCLDCHRLLREQLDKRLGYHATVTDQGCERCHMEHHGADFELVYWGEQGETAFDHGQSSFELLGAHTRLQCRSCHKAALIHSQDSLRARGKDLSRTFLGLDGSECVSCHLDEHRGQFSDRSCESCHTVEKWNEGNLFSHERTRYPLVGRHRQVECGRCHARAAIEDRGGTGSTSFVRYVGLSFASCTDCHRDPHAGRLGSVCSQCHSETGWRSIDMQSFDHGRTRYALESAHRRTRCEACHPTGLTEPIARFENCTDCHGDHHLGQFASRPAGEECDSCHDLEGFRPARFSSSAHQDSSYPLAGAHLAVACDACHLPLDSQQIQSLLRSAEAQSRDFTGQAVHRYTFPSTQCTVCHANPHEESLARLMLEEDCLTCHEIAGWRRIDFDHERTEYSLVDGHRRAGCLDCHRVSSPTEESLRLIFDGVSQDCVVCHQDPHFGQFAGEEDQAICTGCHSFESWKRLVFDHNRDSSFALDGVHVRVECGACHQPQSEAERTMIRYKPLGQECRDCHGGGGLAEPGVATR